MTQYNKPYTREEFFYIPSRSYELPAFISQPDNPQSAPVAVFCHGYMGSKSEKNRHFFRLAHKLTQLGFITVRFDFAGCADSLAPTTAFSIQQGVNDICAVWQFMDDNAIGNMENCCIIGYSLGALIVAYALKKLPFVSGVCLIAGVEHAILSEDEQNELKMSDNSTIWNRGSELSMEFVRDFAGSSGACCIANTHIPIQLIYAGADEVVSQDHFEAYRSVLPPVSPEPALIDGADHSFSNSEHQNQLDDTLIQFVRSIRII